MAGNGFQVRRLSGSIGAEILGIDLACEPGDNLIGEIRRQHEGIAKNMPDNPRIDI